MSCSVGAVRRLCTCMCLYLLPVCRFVPYLPFRVKFSLFRFTHTWLLLSSSRAKGSSMEDGPLAVGHQMTPHARSVKIKSPANNQTPPVSSSPVRVTVRERSLAEYGESGGGGHTA